MGDKKQYTYTWEHGSPESAAHYRDMQGAASVPDLLLLALANARSADEALPPWATGPKPNNLGNTFTPDPWHASACAERACVYIERAQAMMLAQALASVCRHPRCEAGSRRCLDCGVRVPENAPQPG